MHGSEALANKTLEPASAAAALAAQGQRRWLEDRVARMVDQVVRLSVLDGDVALSSIWRIWRRKRDIYVAIRSITSRFKTSLHASGIFRHAFASTEARCFRAPGLDRAVAKWTRAPDQVPGGTLLFQIIIPGLGLEGRVLNRPPPRDLVSLDRPAPDQSLYVSVVETSPGTVTSGPRMANQPTRILATWQTDEGGVVWVVSHMADLLEDNRLLIQHVHDRARLAMRSGDWSAIHEAPGEDPSELRGFLLLRPSDNVGQILDLNFEFLRREFPRPSEPIEGA